MLLVPVVHEQISANIPPQYLFWASGLPYYLGIFVTEHLRCRVAWPPVTPADATAHLRVVFSGSTRTTDPPTPRQLPAGCCTCSVNYLQGSPLPLRTDVPGSTPPINFPNRHQLPAQRKPRIILSSAIPPQPDRDFRGSAPFPPLVEPCFPPPSLYCEPRFSFSSTLSLLSICFHSRVPALLVITNALPARRNRNLAHHAVQDGALQEHPYQDHDRY